MSNLIILTGPTAVGKTALSIELCKAIGGEIISADCMQVYKQLDIGSAKVTPEEMQGIPHHLIDVLDPHAEFDITEFVRLAKKAMDSIYSRGKIPVICGGTGFYIQGLLYDIDFSEEDSDNSIRDEYNAFADANGNEALHELLKDIDLESYESIPANNRRRVIRALEYYKLHNAKISEHNKLMRQKKSNYNFCYFVLNDDRAKLYDRINKRVDIMINNGLLDEVKGLKELGLTSDNMSMKGIGYAESLAYLNGECTLEEAVEAIKQNSRHYAKRQLTWFRRERDVTWLDRSELKSDEQILQVMLQQLKLRGIIND